MLQINIPGMGELKLTDLMLDYNGTLAVDGYLISGVEDHLNDLASQLNLHIVTGDTHGTAANELANVNCQLSITPHENQAITKRDYLAKLGKANTVAIGNGNNDQYIVKEAQIGIVVLGIEGAASITMVAADIIIPSILDALDLLQNPDRLIATLRL